MAGKVVYIPIYEEHLTAMRAAGITAEQLGRAVYAVAEILETGSRPNVDADIMLPFILMAQKLEEAQNAYDAKVKAGREAAQRQHEQKAAAADPEEEPAQEEAEQGTQGYPRVPKDTQANKNNKNKNNKNIKEKVNEKEKKPAKRGTGPPGKQNESLNYSMRNDDLNKVIMQL